MANIIAQNKTDILYSPYIQNTKHTRATRIKDHYYVFGKLSSFSLQNVHMQNTTDTHNKVALCIRKVQGKP